MISCVSVDTESTINNIFFRFCKYFPKLKFSLRAVIIIGNLQSIDTNTYIVNRGTERKIFDENCSLITFRSVIIFEWFYFFFSKIIIICFLRLLHFISVRLHNLLQWNFLNWLLIRTKNIS